jgi:hypothetical protein
MLHNRIPLVPSHILKAHRVYEPNDTRFTQAVRFLQALWREEKGLPIGTHRNPEGKRRKLGSRIESKFARQGGNFHSPAITKLVLRETVYREIGAMIEEERLWTNLMSSQPLCFNLFGPMKLDVKLASQFFKHLFPDYVAEVTGIHFEHSPGRGNPEFTADYTAFDVFVQCITVDGESGFIAIEMKYTETMAEPLSNLRPRYDELSAQVGIYKEPGAEALRASPLQQLWREHMLSRAMITGEPFSTGRFVVIYPKQNHQCASAVKAYQKQLISTDPEASGFQAVTLDDCVKTLYDIGEQEIADAMFGRYLDFKRVDEAIFG